MKILSFGEIIWDIYPNKRCIGGAPLNFAAHTVKSGAKAFLISAVGNDTFGLEARKELIRLGIDDCFVACVEQKETGRCNVTLTRDGIPSYAIQSDAAYDYIPFPKDLSKGSFDAIAFGTMAIFGDRNRAVLKRILDLGIVEKVYCDLNLRAPYYNEDVVDFCLCHANFLKVSDEELFYLVERYRLQGDTKEAYAGALVNRFCNLELVIVTSGEKGAFVYEKRGDVVTHCDAVKVKVASTVGAGDSFGAVFLVESLKNGNMKTRLQKAMKRSAFVVAHEAAIPDGIES